jgi:hypothetical protein
MYESSSTRSLQPNRVNRRTPATARKAQKDGRWKSMNAHKIIVKEARESLRACQYCKLPTNPTNTFPPARRTHASAYTLPISCSSSQQPLITYELLPRPQRRQPTSPNSPLATPRHAKHRTKSRRHRSTASTRLRSLLALADVDSLPTCGLEPRVLVLERLGRDDAVNV